jgi:DNA-binding GntR family transcriptional regulator
MEISSVPTRPPQARLTVGPSLAEQAYEVLREMITAGELAPGERLTERGLAERLGVSATPVREAITRLTHERLLVRPDGRTLQVAAPSLQKLRDMSMIHAALNGIAARLAVERASDSELAEIARVYETSTATVASDHSETAELRHEFHQLIVNASHSPSLIDMIATAEAFGRSLRLRGQRAPGAAENILRADHEHRAIVDALLARDGERAEQLVRDHTTWVGDRYLAFAETLGPAIDANEGRDVGEGRVAGA